MELKQSSVEVTDTVLRLRAGFPDLPGEVLERFPSMGTWQAEVNRWWRANQNTLQDFSNAVTSITEVGGVLTVDGDNGAMFIRKIRGEGAYAEPDTAFYVNDRGFFSLKNSLTWNPDTNTLTITGTIIADAGEIGGFEIGTDYIRDAANSFGLSSVVTGGDDVRFFAGNTFANRATAPFRVYESGAVVATNATITGTITASSGTIGGFSIGSDYIRDAANSMGLASTVTGADDVRFWAGNTFANRSTAPFRIDEFGNGALGGFTFSAGGLVSGTGAGKILLASTGGAIAFSAGDDTVGSGPNVQIGASYYSVQGSNGNTVADLTVTGTTSVLSMRNSASTVTASITGSTGSITGVGTAITALAAGNITSGTLATARLPATINIATAYQIGGTQVVTAQQAAIASAGTANNLDATYNETQLEALFDAFGAKTNEILVVLRTHGLIAT